MLPSNDGINDDANDGINHVLIMYLLSLFLFKLPFRAYESPNDITEQHTG